MISIYRLGNRRCAGNQAQGDWKIEGVHGISLAFLPVPSYIAD